MPCRLNVVISGKALINNPDGQQDTRHHWEIWFLKSINIQRCIIANTVNINHTEWDGRRGVIHYALTGDGTEETNLQLVDISSLAPAPAAVKIRTIQATLYGNFTIFLEFDATTDEEFARIEGQTADVSFEYVRDFTDFPGGGWHSDKDAAGYTGDLFLTTLITESGDGFEIVITFEKDR